MPAAISLDTLKFAKRLTDAGMDPRHAEAIVLGLSEADTSELATKADLAEVKRDLTVLITDVKAELFRHMLIQGASIVGLTVALIKLLP